MRKPKVVIVGAGPGGLASAMQLAGAGVDVTVVERLPFVGGRTSNFEADGFRFDLGPTFFLYPRVLKEVFSSVDRDLFDEVPMRKLDPQYRVSFDDGSAIDATPNIAAMEDQIARLAPSDHGQLTKYMTANRSKLSLFRPILERPFNSWKDLFSPEVLRALPAVKPWNSLGKELASFFNDKRLQIAFSFQSKYLGMSPFRCPSLFSILSFLEYEHGVFHPIGGCGQVSQRMADIAREMGVKFHLETAVRGFEFEGKRVTSVLTEAESIDCDAVVVNADFAQAMKDLVPDRLRSRWSNSRLQNSKYSCSTFMMYLGVEGEFPELAHHTIHIADDYEDNLAEIEKRFEYPQNPSFYVQNAGVTDPTLAPQGQSALYVLVPVSHQNSKMDWNAQQTAEFRARTFKRLERIGLQGLENRIRYERLITPNDWQSQYRIFKGATFNLAHNLGQMLHLRPHNRFEDLQGVYLVGGGTHPGSGLPVIYESSRITCKEMAKDLGFPMKVMSPVANDSASVDEGFESTETLSSVQAV